MKQNELTELVMLGVSLTEQLNAKDNVWDWDVVEAIVDALVAMVPAEAKGGTYPAGPPA